MEPIDVTSDSYTEYNEDSNKKDFNLKLAIMLGFQNTKTFLLKDTLQIGQKKFLLLVKIKKEFPGHMLLMIWKVNQLLHTFMKKNCKKLVNKNLK